MILKEGRWDHRHTVVFSKDNEHNLPNQRSYFDRHREPLNFSTHPSLNDGLQSTGLKPTWKLPQEGQSPSKSGSELSSRCCWSLLLSSQFSVHHFTSLVPPNHHGSTVTTFCLAKATLLSGRTSVVTLIGRISSNLQGKKNCRFSGPGSSQLLH